MKRQNFLNEDEVAGAADGKPFGNALDNAKKGGFE